MNFRYFMPTKVVCGRGCVRADAELLRLGRHALVVTGRSSAQNGALADVCAALRENGIAVSVFDRITPNPTPECVGEGVEARAACGADFLVAVGGGSPMDAAKAIALLSVQPRPVGDIFKGGYEPHALPMAHVPTTAGTGSEVTPYAILTNAAEGTKTNLSSPALFPRVAFLDGRYTDTLSRRATVNTAVDALSHGVESMLAKRATPLSDALARESISRVLPALDELTVRELPEKDTRDTLLYASMLAGMAIAQAGTTAVHTMGYYLTYWHGVEHGRANGLLLGETLKTLLLNDAPAVRKLGKTAEHIIALLPALLGEREHIPKADLLSYAARTEAGGSLGKSAYALSRADLERIFLSVSEE